MQFYLSSFRLGDNADRLPALYGDGPVGHISNAIDGFENPAWRRDWAEQDMGRLRELGVAVQPLDLAAIFDQPQELKTTLSTLSGLWVTGGNVFVLRQAMKLSGLDKLLIADKLTPSFVYGGYSAGCCVLSPTLDAYSTVDDPDQNPYGVGETTPDGLGILDFVFMPHYKSDHPESDLIDREIARCVEKGINYRAFRDGEVLQF